jgi:hypothetical protein
MVFSISETQRSHIASQLEIFKDLIPGFKLPSRHSLNRYLDSFREGFHAHMPFVHFPTFKSEECAPELILAFATIGAQYRFEARNAKSLFHTATTIVRERLRRHRHESKPNIRLPTDMHGIRSISIASSPSDTHISPVSVSDTASKLPSRRILDSMAAVVVLLGFTAWESIEVLQEAGALKRIIVELIQETGLDDLENDDGLGWLDWVYVESARRVRLVAFTWLNTMTIAYNNPPVLLSSSVKLRLPAASKVWNSWSEEEWRRELSVEGSPQLRYQEALSLLLTNSRRNMCVSPRPTPLGSYVLLHGLLQRIYLVRELSGLLSEDKQALPVDELERFS